MKNDVTGPQIFLVLKNHLAGSISLMRLRGMVARPTEKPTNVVTIRGRGSHWRPGGTEVRIVR